MKKSWNRGHTKLTHPSVLKTSLTMKKKRLDNFLEWRNRAKESGIIPSGYLPFVRNGDLAELIGVILGDGHIKNYPRTEELSIFANSNNAGFIKRCSDLIENVAGKKPILSQHGKSDCTRLRIYQKNLQKRFRIPFSPRRDLELSVPTWILKNRNYIVRYLRGLYEAEGSHSVHEPTSTYKVFFSNRNKSLLENVHRLVTKLGFHPHFGKYNVQISRKKEVYNFIELIQFRKY